jgi:hypothetical protein
MALDGLQAKEFSPDAIEAISIDQLAELTQLAEGKAAGLQKFARTWNSKMERKHAKWAQN